jgi:hypothetical protein
MRFPVDTSALRLTVAGAPQPLRRPALDRDPAGQRMRRGDDAEPWRVPLRVTGAGQEQAVSVTVAGDPRLAAGAPVSVEGLALLTWKRPGGCGSSLRARAIRARADVRQASEGPSLVLLTHDEPDDD